MQAYHHWNNDPYIFLDIYIGDTWESRRLANSNAAKDEAIYSYVWPFSLVIEMNILCMGVTRASSTSYSV